jgi:hypothetical protein
MAIVWDTFIILAFSTAPFWLPGILLSFLAKNQSISYFDLSRGTFSQGELLIAATGLLGPVVMLLSEHPKSADASWTRKILIIASFIGSFVAVATYGFLRSHVYAGTFGEISEALVLEVSVWMLAVAALVRFSAISYSRFQFEAESFRSGEKDFSDRFSDRHKGEH